MTRSPRPNPPMPRPLMPGPLMPGPFVPGIVAFAATALVLASRAGLLFA